MPIFVGDQGDARWQRLTWRQRTVRWLVWITILTACLIAWQLSTSTQNWSMVTAVTWQPWLGLEFPVPVAWTIARDLFTRAVPPDVEFVSQLGRPIWDTINIATLGTLLGFLLGAPVALLAARNTTPHASLRALAIFIIVSTRSINTLIWGLLLVVIVGPGVLAGVLAIAIRSVGFIAKLLYEAIEEVDPSPIHAIRSTGASRWQIISHGIYPQVKPACVGIGVFRWDINIRESAIIGYVGAGGIGLMLKSMVDYLYWDRALTILIVIFLMVLFSEAISAWIRNRIH